jgi:glutamine amidotransferase
MIAILDYGVGNLRSVHKAFESVAIPLRIPVDIVDRPTDLTRWRAVVLPGQGAFGDSVDNLRRQELDRPLLDAVQAGLPLLGICVGMQLLFDESEEMGQHEGLHLIPGKVTRFPDEMPDPMGSDGRCLRVPQIGWNQLHLRHNIKSQNSAFVRSTLDKDLSAVDDSQKSLSRGEARDLDFCAEDELLAGVPDGAYAYFAHSYYCRPEDDDAILAATDYGIDYASIVRYKNAWGIQPHPEKSHTVGLRILANFMRHVMRPGEEQQRSRAPQAAPADEPESRGGQMRNFRSLSLLRDSAALRGSA